jgi:hypothetical protein
MKNKIRKKLLAKFDSRAKLARKKRKALLSRANTRIKKRKKRGR